ncbi:hypothetical protein ACFU53_26380 [Streptomyces sp. NPDC057474]|uniref:tetratricopeptide repeat protein n=1 Tax=Streptomyces sp. NPDC057474 TaxID=3346144 RepID=UPI00367E1AC7
MTRLSREQKRELKRAGRAPAGLTPIDVRVSAEAGATVGGMQVPPAAGESFQTAALDYLHRLALATGHPVLATVHDERIGYVVPLQIHVDGSSHYAGEPVRVGEPRGVVGAPENEGGPGAGAAHESAAAPVSEGAARWVAPEPPRPPAQAPRRDRSTHVLRAVPESAAVAPEVKSDQPPAEPVDAAAPEVKREPRTMPLTAAKEKQGQSPEPTPGGVAPSTFVLRAVPEPKEGPLAQPPRNPGLPLTLPGTPVDPANDHPPTPEPTRDATPAAGTVSPPTGEFGPATDPVLPPPPARTTPQHPWPADQATTPPQAPSDTPRSAPPSLEPQPWPPSQNPAPVRDSAHAPDAEPTHEPGPVSPESRPWPPSQNPARVQTPAHTPDAMAFPEPKHVSPNPLPWPPAPTDDPTQEPAHEPSPSSAPAPAHPSDPVPVPESGPASLEPQPWPPTPPPMPIHATPSAPTPAPAPHAPAPPEESATDAYSAPEWKVLEEDSAPKPAPVREFDAVAEAVLDTADEDGGTASPFGESVSRINEAVKLGRIQEAAEMAEQTVAQATATLGPQHSEVLKLRELTAYIAYLAGDALRSFHLSLDLAGLRHRMRDQRAAYGNVQSAAAAWRAVRDPLQGLHLGRDLIAVWTDLAADAGPAADDLEQLEKARTRMTRLTERARALDPAPYAHGQ